MHDIVKAKAVRNRRKEGRSVVAETVPVPSGSSSGSGLQWGGPPTGPTEKAMTQSENGQDDVNMEIKGQKRGEQGAREALVKRFRQGA